MRALIRKIILEELAKLEFSNWVQPNMDKLKQEFRIENDLKHNNFFDSFEDFFKAIRKGKIVTITPEEDKKIDYRSRTKNYDELLNLIKSYRSYPEFRNEKTLKDIYNGFKQNKPMEYPIVIEFKNGRQRIFSGNTRMDVAFQSGINPKVILIKNYE